MNITHWRRARWAAAAAAAGSGGPVVPTGDGPVRGMTAGTMNEFLGIPCEFNDDAAPPNFTGPLFPPPVATHESELQYLFDLPNAQHPAPLNPGQQALAASMQTAWTHFAATGNPATAALPWPAFTASSTRMLSLVPPQPQLDTGSATAGTGRWRRHRPPASTR